MESESSSPPAIPQDLTLEQVYCAALQAVAEHGVRHALLPPTFEAVRQKYNMAIAEYDTYWKLAAESQMKGVARSTQEQLKARRRLKEIKKEHNVRLALGGTVPSHKSLMNEAWRNLAEATTGDGKSKKAKSAKITPAPQSGKKVKAGQTKALAAPIEPAPATSASTKSASTIPAADEERAKPVGPGPEWRARIRAGQALLADIKTSQPSSPSPQNVDQALRQVDQQMGKLETLRTTLLEDVLAITTPAQEDQHSETQEDAISTRKRSEVKNEQMYTQQKEIEELQATLAEYKQQLTAFKATELEQQDKAEQLKKRKANMLKRKMELLESLEAIDTAPKAAKMAELPTPRTLQDKKASFDLNDILDVAVEETTEAPVSIAEMHMPAPAVPPRRHSALFAELESGDASGSVVEKANISPAAETKPAMLTHEPASASLRAADVLTREGVERSGLEVAQRRRPSDSLRLSIPPSRKIEVDSDLTVDLNADIPQLQTNVFQMQERLKSSYPRIDALPYEVWKSHNRNTLQTWLKILITRWRSRFDDVTTPVGAAIDPQVKAVLDQMVRDHDLSNESAKRMAKKWVEIMHNQGAMSSDAGGAIDWDEFDAGGMSFLRTDEQDDVNDVLDSNAGVEAEKTPIHPPQTAARSSFAAITRRLYSTSSRRPLDPTLAPKEEQTSPAAPQIQSPQHASLPHLTPSGSAHMVSVSAKPHTVRTAIAVGTVYFSNATPLQLIKSNSLKKGDVLSVSRIAGIMAAKKCPDLIPLCHPIPLTHVGVELRVFSSPSQRPSSSSNADSNSNPHLIDKIDTNDLGHGGVAIEATVSCTGPTGVEMEALTSVMGAALSVVDMCKAVDKFQRVQDVRVVLKEGGKSGRWREEGWGSWQD